MGGDGFEALVYNSNNNLLGEIFVKHALSVGQNSRGVKYRPELAVLRLTNMPAVLNEIAFVDNMKDIKDWDEDHEIKKMGEAMARAAAEYLILSKKSSGSLNNITSNRNDEFKVKIIADILNIRRGPSTSHQKIGTVKKGEVYTIVKTSADGKWGLLKAGPIKGSSYICISSDYVKREEFKVKITVDSLNIRKGPSTNYKKIGTVKKGEVYTIVNTSADDKWGLLKAGPIKGSSYICISSDYVKRV